MTMSHCNRFFDSIINKQQTQVYITEDAVMFCCF